MKLLNACVCALLLLCTLSCEKDDVQSEESKLPPITMTGENTFGCLIDGKYFRPRDGRSTINSNNKGLRVVQTETDNWEIHVFDRKSNKTGALYIHLENYFIDKEGHYQIDEANGSIGIDGPDKTNVYGRFWNSKEQIYSTYYSYADSGVINVTKDNHNPGNFYIISGEFSAKLINTDNQLDTLEIKSGRFDIESISLQYTNFD